MRESNVFVESVLARELLITMVALVLDFEVDSLDVAVEMRLIGKLESALGTRPTHLDK